MKKKKYQHGREMMRNLSNVMIDPNVINEQNHFLTKSKTVPMEGYISSGHTVRDPASNVSPSDDSRLPAQQTGTEIGKDNYMQALKLFKKGGSK